MIRKFHLLNKILTERLLEQLESDCARLRRENKKHFRADKDICLEPLNNKVKLECLADY